ncbi:increased loss of mitochondrial DNA protein 1 [Apodospora peruviana]|uniref:Increased loss of mitochondrial DNA protein 1 n=1 Tax=Apodospora peruviana TaxID=516989 RepID=A0AAE0IBA7_9PEZI|nr:increased loss of mitochondrial DNA protein 1 [Apodospora peruviana]
MALISCKTILTSLCLFHITLGYFFLTSPSSIADQAMVYLLGESMGLPHVRSFETQSPANAFLGIILAIFGVSDLVTLSRDEFDVIEHWGIQAPLRLLITFFLTLYTFFFSASSPLYASKERMMAHPSAHHANPNYVPAGWGGDALKNRVFFTFMFVETVSWLWVWVTLQEERRDVLLRRQASAAARARRRSSAHL